MSFPTFPLPEMQIFGRAGGQKSVTNYCKCTFLMRFVGYRVCPSARPSVCATVRPAITRLPAERIRKKSMDITCFCLLYRQSSLQKTCNSTWRMLRRSWQLQRRIFQGKPQRPPQLAVQNQEAMDLNVGPALNGDMVATAVGKF